MEMFDHKNIHLLTDDFPTISQTKIDVEYQWLPVGTMIFMVIVGFPHIPHRFASLEKDC
jgi:ATP-dependent RNA circularization protein (DNA/RNA ligase family)